MGSLCSKTNKDLYDTLEKEKSEKQKEIDQLKKKIQMLTNKIQKLESLNRKDNQMFKTDLNVNDSSW